jgi:cell division protein ZapA
MEPGAPEKRPVRVIIYNQPYTLLASGEAGDTEALAQQVDDLMTRIASRAGNIDSTRAAVLTALHLADQLHILERELSALKQRVDERSRELSVLLDKTVIRD